MSSNKILRILFMGTPDFAVHTLNAIHKSDHQVLAVITAPDRPAGRGKQLRQSPVKEYALTNDLLVLQPTNLKNEEFVAQLKELDIDIAVVVAFRMLPKVVWELPTYGTFNLHASLLPDYRGAAPINWVLINGEEKTGATTFYIDHKIDTGEILLQTETAISEVDTAGTLHDTLMESGAQLVLKTLEGIANKVLQAIPQPERTNLNTAYKLTKENTKIDWNTSSLTIYNLIRGLNPYPGAWCYLTNKGKQHQIKIHRVLMKFEHDRDFAMVKPGELNVQNGHLFARTSDGVVSIEEIQIPGKKMMSTKALLNGYDIEMNAKFS